MARLGPFEQHPHLAVAVSGGSDSIALMCLLAEWSRDRGGRLTVLTVDHGLRPESAGEAATVGVWAERIGVTHVCLSWQGDKPLAGLQAAARQARYELLIQWCRAAGVLHLAVAHQADDQRETVAMRAARDGGLIGTAGMSAVAARQGIRLLRPLLGTPRRAIMEYLQRIGQPWIEDPSNQATRFERIRWRQGELGALPGLDEIRNAGTARRALELAAADLLMRAGRIAEAGYALIDPRGLSSSPTDTVDLAIGQVIAQIGGAEYRPAGLAQRRDLAAVLAGAGVRTLGGCLIGLWRGSLLICREAGSISQKFVIDRPGGYRWDRRFAVEVAALPSPVELGMLGEAGLREMGDSAAILAAIPPLARASLPALRDATGRLIRVPFTEFDPFELKDAFICRLLPENSATSSGFTVA
jgi:tRNA(Ile)-lysidine synthase